MKSYRQQQAQKLYETMNLRILRSENQNERLGNELKDVRTGGKILKSPFQQKTEDFKRKLAKYPDAKDGNKKALGDLGMDQLGKSTFKSDKNLKAGRTPTLSKGVPVQEAMLSTGDMRDQAGPQIQQLLQNVDSITQRIIGIIQNKPAAKLQQIGQELQQIIPLLIQQQSPIKAKLNARTNFYNAKNARQNFGQTQQEPEQPQVGQAGTASLAACKKV